MALKVLFEGTVPKYLELSTENEDAYRLAPEKGRLMVADGASESYDARSWARLLVDRMIDEDLSSESLASCVKDYEAIHDPSELSWSRAAAYDRGSFATLLSVQDVPERFVLRVTVVGDSLAVWVDGLEILESVPYKASLQFQEKPMLLATRIGLNDATEAGWPTFEWGYGVTGYRMLLCMTDAVGAWLLMHQEQGDTSALETLCKMRDEVEFITLVEGERAAGRMRRDDATLVVAAVMQA